MIDSSIHIVKKSSFYLLTQIGKKIMEASLLSSIAIALAFITADLVKNKKLNKNNN